ncbi:DUF975 family protein [Marasmitruncus massiliensis]|uniref:DUF975 family protein n=1 Tax=Marasmitruncus massiliensis TaxID=1944642 RepID=UPI000C7B2534|nr:DUF975 family protein [Marasmitruncus massiliensis]
MWQREQIKWEAKQKLRRFYWMAFAVCLTYLMIGGGVRGIRFNLNFDLDQIRPVVGQIYVNPERIPEVIIPVLIMMAGGFFVFLISLLVRIFVHNVLEVGYNRFFMESRQFASRYETLFAEYTHGSGELGNVVITLFFRDLKLFLWKLLLIIPGIIKYYEYKMVPYILCECPTMPRQRVFELSRLMTDGEKMKLFVLDLSFIGWYLLALIPCGLGIPFLYPYISATKAELYTALREKAFGMGFSSPGELPGFSNS